MIREWRRGRDLPEDPMTAFRESGYLERITRERHDRNMGARSTYA
jgi:L-rhamnose isomerase/sugar isomerase